MDTPRDESRICQVASNASLDLTRVRRPGNLITPPSTELAPEHHLPSSSRSERSGHVVGSEEWRGSVTLMVVCAVGRWTPDSGAVPVQDSRPTWLSPSAP